MFMRIKHADGFLRARAWVVSDGTGTFLTNHSRNTCQSSSQQRIVATLHVVAALKQHCMQVQVQVTLQQ